MTIGNWTWSISGLLVSTTMVQVLVKRYRHVLEVRLLSASANKDWR
jgi:hypothetical protein